jgi:ABC-type transport system involved in Fe-S cluster assembly, ATPase component
MTTLEIHDLHVSVTDGAGEAREILRGVDLTVSAGQTHAIMGPNGSGKSTLAYAIAGHPKYLVTQGSITLDGEDVLAMSVDARARAGLFLAMQYPVEVPGVSVSNFLARPSPRSAARRPSCARSARNSRGRWRACRSTRSSRGGT